jgi:hypothetical protein
LREESAKMNYLQEWEINTRKWAQVGE